MRITEAIMASVLSNTKPHNSGAGEYWTYTRESQVKVEDQTALFMMAIHLPLCVSNAQVDALVICKMDAPCILTANISVLCEILIVSGGHTHH